MKDRYTTVTSSEAKKIMYELLELEDDGKKRPKDYWRRHEVIMEYLQLRISKQI